jgi:hypothetical protein
VKDKGWLERRRKAAGIQAESVEVRPEYSWLWLGFCFLSARRLVIQGASQSIQMSEIESYYRFMGYPQGWSRILFLNVMDKLDERYLEIMRQKAEKSSPKGTRQMGGHRVR